MRVWAIFYPGLRFAPPWAIKIFAPSELVYLHINHQRPSTFLTLQSLRQKLEGQPYNHSFIHSFNHPGSRMNASRVYIMLTALPNHQVN